MAYLYKVGQSMKVLCLLSLLTLALNGCTSVLQGFMKGFTSRPIYYPVPVGMAPVSSYPPGYYDP